MIRIHKDKDGTLYSAGAIEALWKEYLRENKLEETNETFNVTNFLESLIRKDKEEVIENKRLQSSYGLL